MSKSGVEYIIELQRRATAMNLLQAYIWLRWPLTDHGRYPAMLVPKGDIYERILRVRTEYRRNMGDPKIIHMRPSAFWALSDRYPSSIIMPPKGEIRLDTIFGMEIKLDYMLPEWADFMISSEREEAEP